MSTKKTCMPLVVATMLCTAALCLGQGQPDPSPHQADTCYGLVLASENPARVITSGRDGQLILWRIDPSADPKEKFTIKPVRRLNTTESKSLLGVDVQPQLKGRLVATGGSDGKVGVWLRTDRAAADGDAQLQDAVAVAASRNGPDLAVARSDGVKLLRGQNISDLVFDKAATTVASPPKALAWCTDRLFSDRLAVADASGLIRHWDAPGASGTTGEPTGNVRIPENLSVLAVAVTRSNLVVACKEDGLARIYSLISGGLSAPVDVAKEVALSADGSRVAFVDTGKLKVQPLGAAAKEGPDLAGGEALAAFALTQDGKKAVYAVEGATKDVRLWDVDATGAPTATSIGAADLNDVKGLAAYQKNGETLVLIASTSGGTGNPKVITLRSTESTPSATLPTQITIVDTPKHLGFGPGGRSVLYVPSDAPNEVRRTRFKIGSDGQADKGKIDAGAPVKALAMLEKDNWIAVVANNEVRVFRTTADDARIDELERSQIENDVDRIALTRKDKESPAVAYHVPTTSNGTIRQQRLRIKDARGNAGPVKDMVLAPSGRWMASIAEDGASASLVSLELDKDTAPLSLDMQALQTSLSLTGTVVFDTIALTDSDTDTRVATGFTFTPTGGGNPQRRLQFWGQDGKAADDPPAVPGLEVKSFFAVKGLLTAVLVDGTARVLDVSPKTAAPRARFEVLQVAQQDDGLRLVPLNSNTKASDALILGKGRSDRWPIIAEGKLQVGSDIAEGQQPGPLLAVAWHPKQDAMLATGSADSTLTLHEVKGSSISEAQKKANAHDEPINVVAFPPIPTDGLALVTADDGGVILCWKGQSGGTPKLDAAPEKHADHTGPVYGLAFNDAGDQLASASGDLTVRLWTINASGKVDAKTKDSILNHDDAVVAVCFSKDSNTLYTLDFQRTISVWDLRKSPPEKRTIRAKAPDPGKTLPKSFALIRSPVGDGLLIPWRTGPRFVNSGDPKVSEHGEP